MESLELRPKRVVARYIYAPMVIISMQLMCDVTKFMLQ